MVTATQPQQAPVEGSFQARTRSSNPASVGGAGVKNHGADVVSNIPVVQKTQCGLCLGFARAVIHDGYAKEFTLGISWGTTDQNRLSFFFCARRIVLKQFSIPMQCDMHRFLRLEFLFHVF